MMPAGLAGTIIISSTLFTCQGRVASGGQVRGVGLINYDEHVLGSIVVKRKYSISYSARQLPTVSPRQRARDGTKRIQD